MAPGVDKTIEHFFNQFPTKHYKNGQIIIYAHEEPDGIFHIIKGNVRQYDINDRGDEIVVNVFKPPAFFPLSWAINDTAVDYFFETFTECEFRIAPKEKVIEFLKSEPEVMYDLLSRLYTGMLGMQRRMALLMGSHARQRVVFELILECERFGVGQPDGSYRLDLHGSEFAARSGLTRETVSRELRKLHLVKAIEVRRTDIVIFNLPKLKKILTD